MLSRLGEIFQNDPIKATALAAALIAIATTPIAFAVLGRLQWFEARRGRTMMRPAFWSICCGMALVMGIPAIFAALVIKSADFDKNRYEFDPNKTWSPLEQGRGFADVKAADAAVKAEAERLAVIKKNLVDTMKKLDESMLALRAVAGTSPAVAQTIPDVLQRLAGVRRSVGLDGPQQLMDFTAPPADIRGTAVAANMVPAGNIPQPAPASAVNVPTASSPIGNVPPTAAPAGGGMTTAEVEAEVAGVPGPQKTIAAMLPLADLPPGWVIGKNGPKHLETFNAENLFEKIDGRAESFIQYDVKGMAYAYYHPAGDESNEVQLYIFEMANPLKAMGKYGSEKPEEIKAVAVGSEGYTSAGSLLFHAGPYYTQIVSTQDNPKFAAFALDLAKRVAAKQQPQGSVAGGADAKVSTLPSLSAILPKGQGRGEVKYVAQDVFGYSFLTDVFMADYKEGDATWQGFLRPYASSEAAQAVFDKYLANAKQDGAQVKTSAAEGADAFAVSSNIGLADAVFRKGNVIGGANGATDPARAEAYAKALVKALPASLPPLESEAGGNAPAAKDKAPKAEEGSAEKGESDQ